MRAAGLFGDVPIRARLIGWSLLLGPFVLLALLGFLFLRSEPIARASLLGCYEANGAPWLRIDADGIRIGEPEQRAFRFVAEPAKEGYQLSVQPALTLSPLADGRYVFRAERGIGYFWPLLTSSSDRPDAMRRPSDFGGRFRIIARDGAEEVYVRSSNPQACR